MPYEQQTGVDLLIDVSVLAAVIAFIPSNTDKPYAILISFIAILIVAMESKVRRFRLTSYMNEGVNAFRPMFWATALLLIVLYYKPMQGVGIWDNTLVSFFLSTMLVFLAILLVAYRAAAHNN